MSKLLIVISIVALVILGIFIGKYLNKKPNTIFEACGDFEGGEVKVRLERKGDDPRDTYDGNWSPPVLIIERDGKIEEYKFKIK